MSLSVDYLSNLNQMFDNLSLNKNSIDESQREKFVSRTVSLKNAGIDITETSKITGSFFREFSDVPMSTSPTHEERLTALSQRYSQMHDELGEMFKDDENEYYNQIEKLNMAFKGTLDSTYLTPIYSFKTVDGKLHAFTQDQEDERIKFEKEKEKTYAEVEQYNKNVQGVMKNFRTNLLRHVNTFYESFINSIQTNDFDIAYQESINSLKSTKTISYNEISYSDMVHIMEVINNVPDKFDENGAVIKMRYDTAGSLLESL